jgi:hypothetical protein
LDEMRGRLFPIMDRLVPDRASALEEIALSGVREEEAFATFTRFADGSCRVLVSDGLIGLLRMLCDLTCVWYQDKGGRGWRASFRLARDLQRLAEDEESVPILAVALRWNLIHRRLWGKGATLPVEPSTDASQGLRNVLVQAAWIFVVAHECAHGLLGHGPVDVGNWDAEHAADVLALKATLGTLRIDEGGAKPIHGFLAVRIALTAIDLVEQVLFVRPPASHPSPASRWGALAPLVGKPELARPSVVAGGLLEAARRASNPRYALPAEWWDRAYRHPQVHCDVHEPWYYDAVRLLDRLSFGDPNDPARALKGNRSEQCDRALNAAFAAREGGLRAGLEMLGVPLEIAATAADPSLPLSVYSLVEYVIESPTLQAVPAGERRIPALCAATLLGGIEKGIFYYGGRLIVPGLDR